MSVSIEGLITSINAYIDKYPEMDMSEKQSSVVIEVREVIIDSLRYTEKNEVLDPKKIEDIKKKLDDSFMKVINVLANDGDSLPEIQKEKEVRLKKKKTKVAKKLAKIQKKKKSVSPKEASSEGVFNPTSEETKEMVETLLKSGIHKPELPGMSNTMVMNFLQLIAKRLDKLIKDNKTEQSVILTLLDIVASNDKDIAKLKKQIKNLSKQC